MHVVMLLDNERLAREEASLHTLFAELGRQEVEITAITSAAGRHLGAADESESPVEFAGVRRLRTSFRLPIWRRSPRLQPLADELTEGSAGADVIHAMGAMTWPLAMELSGLLNRPLTIDVSDADDARHAPRRWHARSGHGSSDGAADDRDDGGRGIAAYVAATQPIADLLIKRVGSDLVALARPGVAMSASPCDVLRDPERQLSLAIIGSGRDLPAYRAMLVGLAEIVGNDDAVQAAMELRGPKQHDIWREVRKLKLLHIISTIADASAHHELVTQCDALLVPERHGRVQPIVLEAMAHGLPVLAATDPALDMLNSETGVCIPRGNEREWAAGIRRLRADPEGSRRLGVAARDRLQEHHDPTVQAQVLASVFRRAQTGGVYRFSTHRGDS